MRNVVESRQDQRNGADRQRYREGSHAAAVPAAPTSPRDAILRVGRVHSVVSYATRVPGDLATVSRVFDLFWPVSSGFAALISARRKTSFCSESS